MMCQYPYVKDGLGKMRLLAKIDKEARDGMTPFPCGRCLPCRIATSIEWYVRIMLECMMNNENCFVTLTYSDDNYPENGSLEPKDINRFIRKLRRIIKKKFRYFAVGEYGDETERAHYHIILFGISEIYHRDYERAWTYYKKTIGFVQSQHIAPGLVKYITGYCIKKLTNINDKITKEWLNGRLPEFSRQSRRYGGIGNSAIKKLAKNIRKGRPDSNNFEIPRRIRIGEKLYPLGRYGTEKLVEYLGMKGRKDIETANYQMELIKEFCAVDKDYYDAIVEKEKSSRIAQARRNRIFKTRRKI